MTGGHENISYIIYYREQGLGKRFRQAYYYEEGLDITVFRLAADTAYDMVAVSALDNDTHPATWGIVSLPDSTITLSDNVTSDLMKSGYFDFGVSFAYLFFVVVFPWSRLELTFCFTSSGLYFRG